MRAQWKSPTKTNRKKKSNTIFLVSHQRQYAMYLIIFHFNFWLLYTEKQRTSVQVVIGGGINHKVEHLVRQRVFIQQFGYE